MEVVDLIVSVLAAFGTHAPEVTVTPTGTIRAQWHGVDRSDPVRAALEIDYEGKLAALEAESPRFTYRLPTNDTNSAGATQ